MEKVGIDCGKNSVLNHRSMIKLDVRSVSRLSSLSHNYVTFGDCAANERGE